MNWRPLNVYTLNVSFLRGLLQLFQCFSLNVRWVFKDELRNRCHMNFIIEIAHRGVFVTQWQSIEPRNAKVWGSIPHAGLRIFSLSHARDMTKNIFLYFFTELKTYHLSYSINVRFVYIWQENANRVDVWVGEKNCKGYKSIIVTWYSTNQLQNLHENVLNPHQLTQKPEKYHLWGTS